MLLNIYDKQAVKNKQIQTNNAWKQTKTETPQTEEEQEEQMAIWAVGGIKQINA